jgi:hypothetical protein
LIKYELDLFGLDAIALVLEYRDFISIEIIET